ncbi:PBP1A family penicillin-binding protein [bacterium]|nr:PBP1A family penicillin-binding protein [bacterium]
MNRPQGRRYSRSWVQGDLTSGPSLTSIALGALAVVLVAGALVLTVIQALSTDLPKLEQLETYTPRLITRVLGQDSTVIKEFYTEKRVQVPLDSISPYLVNALLSTEDRRYYNHWGIDPIGIMRAFTVNALSMSTEEGASTLTQQLARNLYLHRRQTVRRKLREMITAVQIERTYSKDEILQMYFTQMYWGHGAYGVQSASKLYFGTSASEITLGQAAMLIGMLRAPNYYSPLRNPDEALRIRNTVLLNMLSEGDITRKAYDEARAEPLVLAENEADDLGIAPYFTEWVRRQLEEMEEVYGFDYYRDGLKVQTTLDPVIQNAADAAVDSHITQFQENFNTRFTHNGLFDWLVETYRDSLRNQGLLEENEDDSTSTESMLAERNKALEDSMHALAQAVMDDSAAVDSILNKYFQVQVALVAMDPQTGDVWAMVGGRDFHRSKFNRAVQADMRQPGSVFKPFVYTTAIDNGIYANYRILNMVQPLLMGDGTWWRPENYNVQNRGEYVSLREGLKKSLNNVTVRMVSGEDRIVPLREVIRYAHRMGISTPLSAVPSLALGAGGVIPIDVVTAYGVFASGGVRSTPRAIKEVDDRNGQVIVSNGIEREVVLSEETSAIMVDLLQGVINQGTGGSSRWKWGFRAPAAGKTGTTNNFTDAWFLGFTPKIVAGVWVGFDDPKKSLGAHQSGAVAALPIWAIFMNKVYEDKGWPWDEFELPVGVVEVPICEDTGMLAGPTCPHVYDELFRRGDEPIDSCDLHRATGGGGGW